MREVDRHRLIITASLLLVVLIQSASGAIYIGSPVRSVSTVAKPNIVFQTGVAGNSTIFTNSTSATVLIPTRNHPTSYNIVSGSYSSGSVPGSVNSVDSNYFVTASTLSGNPRLAATEFIFPVAAGTPAQLNFTVVSQYDTPSVTVTIQVFNYTGNAYPASGQGYLTYTSSSTSGTDETQTLTITATPQFYTSGSEAKIKISASRNGAYNQKFNLVRLYYYQTSSTFDYVLRITNQQATSYNIKLDASTLAPSNLIRVTNFTAWFYNPASVQLQVLSGSLTTSTGPLFNLGASSTIFVAIRLTTTGAGTSTVDCYLRTYPLATTTSHADYRLTFKLT